MDIEKIRDYCLAKKGADEAFPFDDTTLVFRVQGKMFAVLLLDKPDRVILKCNAEYAAALRERYEGVEPAWHFNKKYWNQVFFERDVDDALILHLVDHSLDEVLKKLPRTLRDAYDRLA